jgi:hypothetical protein
MRVKVVDDKLVHEEPLSLAPITMVSSLQGWGW